MAKPKSLPKSLGITAPDNTTKARLERAAVNLFGAQSVDGTSMREIAKAAGMSLGAVYGHYPSKDILAHTLMAHTHRALADMIDRSYKEGGSLRDIVERIIDGYCAAADEDWELFRYYLINLHRFSDLSEAAKNSPVETAAKVIRSAVKVGQMPKKPATLTASMALGVMMQAGLARSYGQIDGPLSQYKPHFNAAVMAVLEA